MGIFGLKSLEHYRSLELDLIIWFQIVKGFYAVKFGEYVLMGCYSTSGQIPFGWLGEAVVRLGEAVVRLGEAVVRPGKAVVRPGEAVVMARRSCSKARKSCSNG